MSDATDKLLEPLKYYERELKQRAEETVAQCFAELSAQAGIDLARNRELAAEYAEAERHRVGLTRKIKVMTWVKRAFTVVKVLWGMILVLLCLGILVFSHEGFWFWLKWSIDPLIFTLVLWGIDAGLIRRPIKRWETRIEETDNRLAGIARKASETLAPLYDLLGSELTYTLMRKILPEVNLDVQWNGKRLAEMVRRYGLAERTGDTMATANLVSGDVGGNPFVCVEQWEDTMVMYTYTGSLPVDYTEYYTDADGNRQSRTKHETLTASVQRQGPKYIRRVSLLYGSEAAPHLSFSRGPTVEAKKKKFSLRKSAVEKNIRKFRKKTNEGTGFQIMTNEEFDGSFNAENRDNEQEFRMLFTPLAQENLMVLFAHSPYHDDFWFHKRGKLTQVRTENSDDWKMNPHRESYDNAFYDRLQENFIAFHRQYFEHLFFTMLPILSIPLYRQEASAAYDEAVADAADGGYHNYLTEALVKKMNVNLFRPENATKHARVGLLLKTYPQQTAAHSEIIRVRGYSYHVTPRVEYVAAFASDGQKHHVPVHWDEYTRVYRERLVEVMRVDTAGDPERVRRLERYERSAQNANGSFIYRNHMAAKLYDENRPLAELVEEIMEA